MDTECAANWWLIKFLLPDNTLWSFSFHDEDRTPLNFAAVQWFIDNYTLLTFNGENYDIPMLSLAMTGANNRQLIKANDEIIVGGLKRWNFYDTYGIRQPRNLDHVDIMEVAPGVRLGLKAYMGRMHAPTIQDLPFTPGARLTADQRIETDLYCGNDLTGNRMLREICSERLELRDEIGEEYDIDVRSKSDAQISEAVVKSRLGFVPEKRLVPHGYTFRYDIPDFIRFSTPLLQGVLDTVRAANFVVYDVDQLRAPGSYEEIIGADGKKIKTGVKMPPELKAMKIAIGVSTYQFGIGGLHSKEESVQHHSVPGVCEVREDDVRSYYPSLKLSLGMYPQQLGPRYLEIYSHEFNSRIEAKSIADDKRYDEPTRKRAKTKSDGKKIVLNGAFGKLFSKYSIMFAPELGIRVTITGQLCILMLIEMLELVGVTVVSANTDGIVTKCPVGREWLRDACVKYWEQVTGLAMEQNYIKSLYAQSVNSYVAFAADGKVKRKGFFAESGVLAGMSGAHPDKDICAEACIAYLKDGTRLETTIHACTDIRKFLTIRAVKGGGVYYPKTLGPGEKVIDEHGAVYLGKTVRWYYSRGSLECIHYMEKRQTKKQLAEYIANGTPVVMPERGNKVAGSDGAQPCMTLPMTFPDDVDYEHYLQDAIKMLGTVGVTYER
jgi:hypothetical protein